MTTQSPPFDIEDVKRIHLLPGDVLLVKLTLNTPFDMIAEFADQMRTELGAIFKDNDIVVHDSTMDLTVVQPIPPTEPMVTKWQKYPDTIPVKSGYYMAYYFDYTEKENLYKALYWNNDNKAWVPWRCGQYVAVSPVYGFLESTFSGHYASDCIVRYDENPVVFDMPLN